jgi:hypothetical protein
MDDLKRFDASGVCCSAKAAENGDVLLKGVARAVSKNSRQIDRR